MGGGWVGVNFSQLSVRNRADGVQSSCSVIRAASSHPSLLGTHQLLAENWQVNPAGKKTSRGRGLQIFSLLSLLTAFVLPKGRMPRADAHQEPGQTTNGCQKPSPERVLLTQGKLQHSSLTVLPSSLTRGWAQTPLLLPGGASRFHPG